MLDWAVIECSYQCAHYDIKGESDSFAENLVLLQRSIHLAY